MHVNTNKGNVDTGKYALIVGQIRLLGNNFNAILLVCKLKE